MDVRGLGSNPEALLHREGFRLLSTRAGALPVWRIEVACRVLKRSKISTFNEFILRAISLGVTSADDVTRLLNLPSKIVDGVISELLLDRYLTINSGTGQPQLELSPTGKSLVGSLVEERVIEGTMSFLVDGLSGEPISVAKQFLLTPDDLDADPRLVLSTESEVDLDFGPDDTPRFLQVQPARAERDLTLLSVLSVESTTKLYVKSTLLLFESLTDPEDRYLRICVDGRQDDHAEELVREKNLLDAMRVRARIEEDQRRVDRLLSPTVLHLRAPDEAVENALEDLRRLAPAVGPTDAEPAIDAQRMKARDRLASMSVRRLSVREASESTEVMVLSARDGVLISASRLWERAQRDHHVAVIRQLMAAGCPVTLETPPDVQLSKKDAVEIQHLKQELREAAIEFSPTKPPNEASFVVVDQASITVFPGSPFAGLTRMPDRLGDDRPTLVRGPQLVQAVIAHAHGELGTGRGRTAELSRRTRA